MFPLGSLNLFSNGTCKFSEDVAALLLPLFSLPLKQIDFALTQGSQFTLDHRHALSGLADLPDDADQFGTDALALHGVSAIVVFVENSTEGLGIAHFLCTVGLGHQPVAALQIGGISAKVGMNPLSDLAEQVFEFRRRDEVARFRCLVVSVIERTTSLLARRTRPFRRGRGTINPGLQLRNSRVPFVQLGVQNAHLPQVATLKRGELAAKIDELQLALCKSCAEDGQLLPLA
jgi:hypothetical protein